jgi:hypothetical protein
MTNGQYFLSKGAHNTPADGRCAMEWVSYIAGEDHTDSPVCVCPALRVFGIGLNDCLPDGKRQQLRPLLARCIGTAGDGMYERRGFMALDWIVRTYTPTWLRLAGLEDAADRLVALSEVVDLETARRAGPVVRDSRVQAAAAGDAARDAAWAAAGAAARDAAWAAAGDAARDALAPTVTQLQDSAFALFERMLPTVVVDLSVEIAQRAEAVTA